MAIAIIKNADKRWKYLSFALIGILAAPLVGLTGTMNSAYAATAEITGNGVGTITLNGVVYEDVTIDFAAAPDASGNLVGTLSLQCNDINSIQCNGIIGVGIVTSGKIGKSSYQLEGELGANGVLGVASGNDFVIKGKLGSDAPISLDSRLPGGGCRGFFIGTVLLVTEPT